MPTDSNYCEQLTEQCSQTSRQTETFLYVLHANTMGLTIGGKNHKYLGKKAKTMVEGKTYCSMGNVLAVVLLTAPFATLYFLGSVRI